MSEGFELTIQRPGSTELVLQPVGTTVINVGVQGPAGRDAAAGYDFILSAQGKPDAAERLFLHVAAAPFMFPAGLAGSRAIAITAPAGDAVFSLRKNGAEFGTLTFPAGQGAGSFAAAAATTFAAGDRLEVLAPASQDASLSDLALTLAATR